MTSTAALLDPQWIRLRPALATFGLALLALLLVHRATAMAMVEIWAGSDTFAHAFLVPPISLWLVWRARDRLFAVSPQPSPIWVLALLAAGAAWLAGTMLAVNALAHFALVTLIVALVPALLGPAVARAMLFPLLFLYFSVPFGDFLLPIAMETTADFTVSALRFTGIPVYREGLHFVIPSGNWSVVEACSGIRYLIASLMVGSLFAYLNYRSNWRRLAFVGVAFVVPIVANWLRAYMIVMIGHLSDNRLATGVDHILYGWVFFGIVITIMFMIGARWSEPDRPPEPALVTAAGPASKGTYVTRPLLLTIALAAVAVALPPLALQATRDQVSSSPVKLEWPQALRGGWSAGEAGTDWQPRFVGAAETRRTTYRNDGRAVTAYVAYYRDQGPGRKLITSANVLVTAEDGLWVPVSVTEHQVDIGGRPSTWRATHLVARGAGITSTRRHLTVWQSYWVDDAMLLSEVRAKLVGARALLQGRGDDGAALAIYTDVPPDEGGHAVVRGFVEASTPAFLEALQRARAASQGLVTGR